jgi:hypothetical protein
VEDYVRAAFYYPWFPETWGSGSTFPNTVYHPSLDYYSTSLGIVQQHIVGMQYAKCRAGIASWWGPSSPYDKNIATCLQAAEGTQFRWCLYYEKEGYSDPTPEALAGDLNYVMMNYAQHPNYLKRNGKPVIFAYADPNDGAAMADRWKLANAGTFHVCLKLFTGYATVKSQPDSWHEYAPASNALDFSPWSFTISPGFAKPGEGVRLARDPARFTADAAAMAKSPAMWKLVTTFNEWGEGTAVEPELGWGSTYLDILSRS